MTQDPENLDPATVRDFGREWQRFDQRGLPCAELERAFDEYFAIFPWESLPPTAVGFDAGCGSGRWAAFVAPRVGHLHCVDASDAALEVAKRNLAGLSNVDFHFAPLDRMPLLDGSMDFGYCLGVLHHLPDPAAGLAALARKLKPGAPLLIYIYYALDNRPVWFRRLWRISDMARRKLSRAPFPIKAAVSDFLAATIYWPLARITRLAEGIGCDVAKWPLSAYRWRSLYTMRNDALDRFGTRIEHRMSAPQITKMMEQCGLSEVRISNAPPFWCALGRKR